MVLKCRCGGVVVDADDERVCSKCGIVYDTAPDGNAGRSGAKGGRPHEWWRLYKLNRMVNRPDTKADQAIERVCSKLALPGAVHRRAASLNNMAVSHRLHRGWNLNVRAAAVVTLACRLERVPRTTKAVCEAAGVKTGQTHHVYGAIVNGLDIRVPPPDPAAYVGSIATACGVPESASRRAVEILRERAAVIPGKDPATLAGAALYMACRENGTPVPQRDLAAAARTSTVSLRLRQRDLTNCAA